jgi:hypothetical protein
MTEDKHAVWLYGSYARNDYDCCSDIDVFIVGKLDVGIILNHIEFAHSHISISQYTWEEVESMAQYGSLFLQHLRLEGRPLIVNAKGDGHLKVILRNLCQYKHINRDIQAFTKCIDDVWEGVGKGSTPVFEMSVIATVLRHSAVLASYIAGSPKFGRLEPFQFVAKRWGFSHAVIHEFERLYQFRLYEDGRASLPFEPSEKDVRLWVTRARKFLAFLKEEANAYQTRVFAINQSRS